jgi:hypothetical protein
VHTLSFTDVHRLWSVCSVGAQVKFRIGQREVTGKVKEVRNPLSWFVVFTVLRSWLGFVVALAVCVWCSDFASRLASPCVDHI